MPHLDDLPEDATIIDLMNSVPELTKLLLPVVENIMRGDSDLTPAEREAMLAYGYGMTASRFCYENHVVLADKMGVPRAQIDSALKGLDAADLPVRLRALLLLVRQLSRVPIALTAQDVREIKAAGFDDRALHDAVLVCSLLNFWSRWVEGAGLAPNKDFARDATDSLAGDGQGYMQFAPQD